MGSESKPEGEGAGASITFVWRAPLSTSAHDAAAPGLIASVPSSPQAKAITHNQLHEETVCRRRQAESHPEVAFPLRPEIEIKHGKKQLLLPAQRIKRGDGAYPAVVFQAPADGRRELIADLRVGGKLKAAVHAFALQVPVEHGIQRCIEGSPLLVENRSQLQRPGIGGEGPLLIADLQRQAEPDGHLPTLRDSDPRADMIPHPLPAGVRLDARKNVEPCLEPRGEPVRNFDGLMRSVLRGEDAVLFRSWSP